LKEKTKKMAQELKAQREAARLSNIEEDNEFVSAHEEL
jgi:hypothetical protein